MVTPLQTCSTGAARAALMLGSLSLLAFTPPMAADALPLRVLATCSYGTTGLFPTSALSIDSSGNLIGAGSVGGANGSGVVFQITTGSNPIVTPLISLKSTQGQEINGITLDSSGNIYGTTQSGGLYGGGAVFKLANDTMHTYTKLTDFFRPGGEVPLSGVTLDGAGNLFGVTYYGGTNYRGSVYEIAAGTTTANTLYNFSQSTNGYAPVGTLGIDSSGNLYGTAAGGGSDLDFGSGTVFEIANDGSRTFSVVTTFNRQDGREPRGGITLDGAGNLYGVTYQGGLYGKGTVFKIASDAGRTLTSLASFTGGADGSNPISGVTLDSYGNIFGAASTGGVNGVGTVYEILAGTNTLTTLAAFDTVSTGYTPYGGVTLDSSGNLFGTTKSGGTGAGTVYEIAGASPTAAPETSQVASLGLLLTGLVAVGLCVRRRKADRSKV